MKKYLIILMVLAFASNAYGAFSENFDKFNNGQLLEGTLDDNGWKGWANNPSAGAYVRSSPSLSTPNSVEIVGNTDLLHEFTGATAGSWTVTASLYVPSSFGSIWDARSDFILLNNYSVPTGKGYSVSVDLHIAGGTVGDAKTGKSTPIIYDRWVPLSLNINLESNTVDTYYNGNFLSTHSWYDPALSSDQKAIAAIALYASGSTGAVYWDDISLTPAGPIQDPGVSWLLAASFPGYGLYIWDGTLWTLLSRDIPENIAASGSTLYGDFGAIGLWKWDGSSWSLLTMDNPQNIAVSGSTVYGDFGALGLWVWNGIGWSQLTSDNPQNMAVSGSTLYASFGSLGLWKHDGSGWSRLTIDNPENIAASGSTLYGDFGAIGLWKWDGSSWSQLTSDNPQNMVVSGSTLYASFGSWGLWKWDGSSWSQLTRDIPENIAASGSTLYGDFGAIGLWKWDGSSWSLLSPNNPSVLITNSEPK
jgi:hypothetical protein